MQLRSSLVTAKTVLHEFSWGWKVP